MKKLTLLLFSLCLSSVAIAQEYSLYQMREVWNANYLNPGFFPRHQFVLSLPSAHTSFNTVGLKGKRLFQYDDATRTVSLNGAIQASDIDRHWTVRNNMQFDALGVGFRAGRAFISMTTQTMVESRLRFPETFLQTLVEGTADYLNTPLDIGPSWEAMAYQKVSLGVGYTVNDRLSIGGRVNRLFGLASFQTERSALTVLQSDDIYQTTVNTNYQFNYYGAGQFNPIDRTVQGVENFEAALTEDDFEATDDIGFRQINQQNNGWSIDLGAEYLLNDRLTLSGAFLNLGRIHWENGTQRVDLNGEFTFEGVDVAEVEEDEDYEWLPGIDTVGSFNAVSGMAYHQALSPRTYIGANYLLTPHIEMGGLLFNELGRMGGFTALSLSGRFSLGRVLALGAVYNLQHRAANSVGANLSLNLGPFQVYGIAEKISTLFGSSSLDGANFRAGLNLSFGRKASEAQLAASRRGEDPFPVSDAPVTLPEEALVETPSGAAEEEQLAPERTTAPQQSASVTKRSDSEAAALQKESPSAAKALSLYALDLELLDEKKQEALEVVYMDLYKEDQNGYQTLLRTGRYLNGEIATLLEVSENWHVAKISAYQYDTLEIRFQPDPDQPLPQKWYLVNRSAEEAAANQPSPSTAGATPTAVNDEPEVSPQDKVNTPEKKPVEEEPTEKENPTAEDQAPNQQLNKPVPSPTQDQETENELPTTEPDAKRDSEAPIEEQPVAKNEATEQLSPLTSDYILTKRTSLREAPNAQSRVISRMSAGTELLLLERTDQWWWRVSMGGWEGYVKAHLLKNKD